MFLCCSYSDLSWYQNNLGLYMGEGYGYFIGKNLNEIPKSHRDMKWVEIKDDFITFNEWKLWETKF